MMWGLIGVAMVGGALLYSVLGVIVGRRLVRRHVAEGHNDVLVPIFLTMGVIYAVLLGFMVVAMLDTYEAARVNTAQEASLLVPLYRQSEVMAPEMGVQMRTLISEYAENVTNGWPVFQQTGKGNPEARKSMDEILKVFSNLRPATKPREIVAQQFLTTFSQLIEVRNKRLLSAAESMSPIIWIVVVGVGLALISMPCILFMDRVGPHIVMTGALGTLIAILIFVMLLLDHPFVGPLAITAEPFEADLALFKQIDSDFEPVKGVENAVQHVE